MARAGILGAGVAQTDDQQVGHRRSETTENQLSADSVGAAAASPGSTVEVGGGAGARDEALRHDVVGVGIGRDARGQNQIAHPQVTVDRHLGDIELE